MGFWARGEAAFETNTNIYKIANPIVAGAIAFMSSDVHEIVTNHRIVLVTYMRQFDRYECDEHNVDECVQHVGKYCDHYCKSRGEWVLLILLALDATLRVVRHVCLQIHNYWRCDARAEPRGRRYDNYEQNAKSKAHDTFRSQWREYDQTAFDCKCHNRVVGEIPRQLTEQVEHFACGVRVADDIQRDAISGE